MTILKLKMFNNILKFVCFSIGLMKKYKKIILAAKHLKLNFYYQF